MRLHVNGFEAGGGLVFGGTDIDADATSRAVLRRDLNRIVQALPLTVARRALLERWGRRNRVLPIVDLDADDAMGADHGTLAALDADVRIPHGDFLGEVALFPLGGAGGVGAVSREGTDGQRIAQASEHLRRHLWTKAGACTAGQRQGALTRHPLWNAYLIQVLQCLVDGAKIHRHDLLTALPVGFLDGFFDGTDGLGVATPQRWQRNRPA